MSRGVRGKRQEEKSEPLWTKWDSPWWWVGYLATCALAGFMLGWVITICAPRSYPSFRHRHIPGVPSLRQLIRSSYK